MIPQTAEPPPPEPKGSAGWKTWLIAGAITAVVVVVGVLVIGGHGNGSSPTNVAAGTQNAGGGNGNGVPGYGGRFGGGGFGGTRGTVTKIDGSTLTVQATDRQGASSTVTVQTSSSTRVTKSVAGTLADLKPGDNIVVTSDDAAGATAVTAKTISDNGDLGAFGRGGNGTGNGPPNGNGNGNGNGDTNRTRPTRPEGAPNGGQRPGGFTGGTITAVDGSTITITSFTGATVTVTTTPTTTVQVTKAATLADVKVGDTVTVTGQNTNGVVNATAIRDGADGFGFGGRGQ